VVPSEVQELLEEGIRTPVRSEPEIGVEEVDADEVIVRIAATPAAESDGRRLADEILAAIAPVTREATRRSARPRAPPTTTARADRAGGRERSRRAT
jgi:hypothetical protein